MGIDQLTFVKSCRQLGRQGILPLRDSYNLYDQNEPETEPKPVFVQKNRQNELPWNFLKL